MAGGQILGRNLGPELDHVAVGSERPQSLFGPPNGTGKSARAHDALEAIPSNALNNVEEAVTKLDFGRLVDKEAGFNCSGHERALSRLSDSTTLKLGDRFMDTGLTRTKVEYVGHKVIGGHLTPIFRDPVSEPFAHKWNELITRADPLRANGRRRLAPRGHSSLLRLPTLTPVES